MQILIGLIALVLIITSIVKIQKPVYRDRPVEVVKEVIIEKPVIKEVIVERIIEVPKQTPNYYQMGYIDEANGIRRNHEVCQNYDACMMYELGQRNRRNR